MWHAIENPAAAEARGDDGPWQTLAKASRAYQPGDVILLRRGDTWDEELRPQGEGTPDRPITIGAYGEGKKPVIDRQDFTKDFTGIRLSNQGGFRIVGLEFNRCMTGIYADYAQGCPTKTHLWIEDCEWGCIDIGLGSGDGEAFDFEGNCDTMTMRNCLFHDTDGPGFLLCCYASDPHPNTGIRMENCVLNGKAKRPIGLPRCEIINTTDWNETTWQGCRFYLARGERLMHTADPEKDKKAEFVACVVKDLAAACGTARHRARAVTRAGEDGAVIELDFGRPVPITEFKLDEAQGSAVVRWAIDCWDAKARKWVNCFNGRTIGAGFVAPIVARTAPKARLRLMQTSGGEPRVATFEAYGDTGGDAFNLPRGQDPPPREGR